MLIEFRGRQNTYRVPKLCLQGDGEQLGVLLWLQNLQQLLIFFSIVFASLLFSLLQLR